MKKLFNHLLENHLYYVFGTFVTAVFIMFKFGGLIDIDFINLLILLSLSYNMWWVDIFLIMCTCHLQDKHSAWKKKEHERVLAKKSKECGLDLTF